MKVYELVKIAREMMKTLHDSCVKMGDYQFLDLYEKYVEMLALGEKTSYIVAVLAEEYCICERKVYYLLSLFQSDCIISALEML